MLPNNSNFPSAEYTLLEDNSKGNDKQAHGGETPLLDPPAPAPVGDYTPPLRPSWLGWVEWFKGCLSRSRRRAEFQTTDDELQEILAEGRKLRLEAEAISDQREGWYQFREQIGRPGWKTVAGAVLLTAAAVLGYDRYKAGWRGPGSPDEGLKPSGRDLDVLYLTPEWLSTAPPPMAADLGGDILGPRLSEIPYQYTEVQPAHAGWLPVSTLTTSVLAKDFKEFERSARRARGLAEEEAVTSYSTAEGLPAAPPPEAAALKIGFPWPKPPVIPYQYTEVQPAQCKTENFLERCKVAHSSAKETRSRVGFMVGNIPCLCPPPAGSNLNYKIIPPTIEKLTVEYVYVENQFEACKTKDFLQLCDNNFLKVNEIFLRLPLKATSGEICLCPPPVPPFPIIYKVVPPGDGWPTVPTSATTSTTTVLAKVGPEIPYQYTEEQPAQCKSENFLERCEVAHSSEKKTKTKMVLMVVSLPCLCPPPAGSNLNYKIIPPTDKKQTYEYQYTEKQAEICLTKDFLQQCEDNYLKCSGIYTRVELEAYNGVICMCPPPMPPYTVNFKVVPPIHGWPDWPDYNRDGWGWGKTTSTTTSASTSMLTSTTTSASTSMLTSTTTSASTSMLTSTTTVLAKEFEGFEEFVEFEKFTEFEEFMEPEEFKRFEESARRSLLSLLVLLKGGGTPSKIEDEVTSSNSTIDGVKIKNLFDFSCIDERNNLSWADVIRQVGITIQQPISALAEESHVIHYYNKGEGCPPHEESQGLKIVTGIIDFVLTMALSLVPGMDKVMMAQALIGPMLVMIADTISGTGMNAPRQLEFAQQMLMMAKLGLMTLSQKEFATLYSKQPTAKGSVRAPAVPRLTDRFTTHDDKLYVQIDGQKYQYQSNRAKIPYVIADDQAKTIRFNQKEKHWEFVSQPDPDNLAYTADGRENGALYGTPLKQLFGESEASIQLDSTDERLLRITPANSDGFLGVAMDEAIISVEKYAVAEETVITASSQTLKEKRVLLYTNYGWKFEQASVEMDKYLGFLLNSKDTGVSYTFEKKFSPIKPNGFSYDELGGSFIKKDNKYYPVYKITEGYAVTGHISSTFIREKSIFKLKGAHDMVFAYKTVKIGYPPLERSYPAVRFEAEGWNYLLEHGIKSNALPISRIETGLYVDNKGQLIFSDGNTNFAASSFLDSQISLKKNSVNPVENHSEIQLWRDVDYYLRIRDGGGKEPFSYSTVSSCRNKRAPGGACLPVLIENSLNSLLKRHIKLGNTSSKTIVDKDLVELGMFNTQFLFEDSITKKYYFLYNGHYFDAKLINVGDKENVTDQIIIQLFKKCDFVSCKTPITSIIIEKSTTQIEIKEQKTFFAEKLNLSKEISDNYLKNRPYHHIVGMNTVEDAVDQVIKSRKMFIEKVHIKYGIEIPDTSLKSVISFKLFPRRIVESHDYSIKIIGINDDPEFLAPYVQEAQANIKQKIEYINKFMIPSAISKLGNLGNLENIESYLSKLLNSDNLEIIIDFSIALRKRLEKIADTLKTANKQNDIYLTTALNYVDEISSSEYPESALTESELREGSVAMMTPDKNKRMYINIDKTYIPFSRPEGAADPINLLIHEASHAEGMATDSVLVQREEGQYISSVDAIDDMIDKIYARNVIDVEEFHQLSKRYLENIAVYRNKIEEILDEIKLAYLAKNDPGYRSHLILNSADLLSLVTIDLHYAAVYGTTTTKEEAIFLYRQEKNILATGSIGTVYDMHNGYVIKDYKGVFNKEYRSRFNSAMNNAEGMNRMYGKSAATAIVWKIGKGDSTVSVKMIKVPGVPLSSIFKISDRVQLDSYRAAVNKFTSQTYHPAILLAEKLRIKGVNHHDINEANLLFDINKGFNLIDFDSADIREAGEPLSSEITADRIRELKNLIEKLSKFVNLSSEQI